MALTGKKREFNARVPKYHRENFKSIQLETAKRVTFQLTAIAVNHDPTNAYDLRVSTLGSH